MAITFSIKILNSSLALRFPHINIGLQLRSQGRNKNPRREHLVNQFEYRYVYLDHEVGRELGRDCWRITVVNSLRRD